MFHKWNLQYVVIVQTNDKNICTINKHDKLWGLWLCCTYFKWILKLWIKLFAVSRALHFNWLFFHEFYFKKKASSHYSKLFQLICKLFLNIFIVNCSFAKNSIIWIIWIVWIIRNSLTILVITNLFVFFSISPAERNHC